VQKELAVGFPYFHLLALAVVGEDICDDCGVVFVDDVVVGVSSGEDDGSAHGDLDMEEGACGNILVVYQGFVDSVEGSICDDLVGGLVLFGVDGSFSGGHSREMAPDLMFGLEVHDWDEFECSDLLSLTLLPQVLPTFDVGGICGLLSQQMWLGRWCSSGVGVHMCVGPVLVAGLLGLGLLSVALFSFLLLSFYGLVLVLLGPTCDFGWWLLPIRPRGIAVASG